MNNPHQSIIDNPPKCFFTSKKAWLRSKTTDQLKNLFEIKKETERIRALTGKEYDEEARFKLWCNKLRANHGRNISKWEAQEIFKENLYTICMSKIGAGEQQDIFESLLHEIKGNRDKLDVDRAKAVDIKDLVRSFGFEIKRGFTKCMFHEDKSASMSFKYNRFKCFGCNASGDSIEFFMKITSAQFPEAVKKLTNQLTP